MPFSSKQPHSEGSTQWPPSSNCPSGHLQVSIQAESSQEGSDNPKLLKQDGWHGEVHGSKMVPSGHVIAEKKLVINKLVNYYLGTMIGGGQARICISK